MKKTPQKILPLGFKGYEYGCIEVQQENDKFYLTADTWSGGDWEEIPEYLYEAILKFRQEKSSPETESVMRDQRKSAFYSRLFFGRR